jgi:phosphatidylglycerophosphatase A
MTEKTQNTAVYKYHKPHKIALKRALKLRDRYLKHLMTMGRISKDSINYHKVILTFFGCGKWKYGPGTFTSLVTTCLWLMVSYFFFLKQISIFAETVMWAVIALIMFIYGVFIVPIYSKVTFTEDDPSIVLDEVMGQIVALSITYPFIKPYYFIIDNARINFLIIISHVSFCFLLFRLLDIAKPSIIGTIDKNMKGGVGVMLDDLVCGIISGVIGVGIFKTLEYFLNMQKLVVN